MRTDRAADRAVVVAAVVLTSVLGGAMRVEAAHTSAPNPKGKQLYLDGKKAYDDGRYDEALTDFQQAFAVDARPAFWFNIGECQRKLGKTSDAVKSYQKYLAGVPKAKNRDEVKKIVADLKAQAKAGSGAKAGVSSSTVVSGGGDASAADASGATQAGGATPGNATAAGPDAAAATTAADANGPASTAPSTTGDAGETGEGVPTWAYVAGGTAAAVAVAAVVGVVTVQALTAPSLGRLDLTSRQGATQ